MLVYRLFALQCSITEVPFLIWSHYVNKDFRNFNDYSTCLVSQSLMFSQCKLRNYNHVDTEKNLMNSESTYPRLSAHRSHCDQIKIGNSCFCYVYLAFYIFWCFLPYIANFKYLKHTRLDWIPRYRIYCSCPWVHCALYMIPP